MASPAAARDVALLVARVLTGVVFLAHGWQKLVANGVEGTAGFFATAGVPLPTLSAWAATLIELVGGATLVLGLAVPVAGALLALNMLGAYLFVHAGNGVFITDRGWGLVGALGAISLTLAAVGASRFSDDHLLVGRRSARSGRNSVAL